MSRCPICYFDMFVTEDGAKCPICGVHYNVEQLKRIDAEAHTWNGRIFNVQNAQVVKYDGGEGKAVIPEGVTSIGPYAFGKALHDIQMNTATPSANEVVIPDTVTEICNYAFSNCKDLEKIWLGRGIVKSCHMAFEGCFRLKEVHVKDLNSWLQISFEKKGIFSRYSSPLGGTFVPLYVDGKPLKDLVLKAGMRVGYLQFCGCKSLETVTIERGVLFEDKSYAFSDCENLKEIRFGYTPSEQEVLYLGADKARIITPSTPKSAPKATAGTTIISDAYDNVQRILKERREKGVCQHCGGNFTLFTKSCKFCGKKKDY